MRTRLRALRQERGLTLEVLAGRTGLSPSALSRLETGARKVSLAHLPALAAGLGVSADDLIAPPPQRDPRVRGTPTKRNGITFWPVTDRGPARGLHAFKLRIDAGRRVPPPPPLPVHEGHDWLYVLDGRLRLVLGDADHVLHPGEVVEFSTWTPHWFGAVEEPVQLLAIFGPGGERLHVREADHVAHVEGDAATAAR